MAKKKVVRNKKINSKKKVISTHPFGFMQILSLIGKPLYLVLIQVLSVVLLIISLLGHFGRKLFESISLIHLPKISFSKLSFPKKEITKYSKASFKEKYSLAKKGVIYSASRIRNSKILVGVTILLAFCFLIYFFILKGLPSPRELTKRSQNVSTKIYDRNGVLLYTIYEDQNRTPVTLDKIPPQVILATLAAEDAEFYTHPGFSIKGILRALRKNLKEGKLTGGSTITQQLVKNALLSSEKTYIRKVREIILSIGVELTFTKDEILEMYLNEVSYGGTAYGIQEAARQYFGKDVDKLNISEAALLAGLPQSPTRYSPFGQNPDLTFSRQREVLHLMKVNKYITSEDEEKASEERITFSPNKTQILAPHFVMYVREILEEEYGDEVVSKGGLNVTTTLDYEIQKYAEEVVRNEIAKLSGLNVGNGALIVLNPGSGEVLAMVGSKDYFNTQGGGNVNLTTRPRQPGSSIKVINYAYALSNGLTAASTIDDSPITYNVAGLPPYTPKNYDGTYRGKISVRSALAESRNIPAVKILYSYGVSKMIELGKSMGITTWEDKGRFGLSLTLGGGEVKLIELAQVYATIANYGVKPEIKSILEVKNFKEKILFSEKHNFENDLQVIDPRVTFILIDILKDNLARSPAFGLNSQLVIPNHPEVAVKTGTSNDLKDNLTIGFNKDYVVAVWVGNNDNTPMSRVASGVTGASPIWNKMMRFLLGSSEPAKWEVPDGLIQKECFGKMEWFLKEKVIVCPKIIEPAASISN